MEPRLDAMKIAPDAYKAVLQLQAYINNHSGLEQALLHLIDFRVSQINGCAYCLDMHSKDARALGETEQRLYALAAWRETPFFTARERAALALAEAVTLVSQTHVPDDVFEEAKKHFSETELVNLLLAISQINVWNRLSISFRAVPGTYQPNVQQMKKSA